MPAAFQPFLEAFKHSKNKRGTVVSATTLTAGSIAAATVAGHTATATLSFPVTGEALILMYSSSVDLANCTVGGVSATDVSNNGTEGWTNNRIRLWRIAITATGNQSVVASDVTNFPARVTLASVIKSSTGGPTASVGIASTGNFDSDNNHVLPSLTIPANGAAVGVLRNDSHGAITGTGTELLYLLNTEGVSIVKATATGAIGWTTGDTFQAGHAAAFN